MSFDGGWRLHEGELLTSICADQSEKGRDNLPRVQIWDCVVGGLLTISHGLQKSRQSIQQVLQQILQRTLTFQHDDAHFN